MAAKPLSIEMEPVSIHTETPGDTRVGKLEFLAGYRLRSSDPAFGGISGLTLEPDGRSFTAVTDQGHWLKGKLVLGVDGRLAGIADADIASILMPDGTAVYAHPGMRDAEAVERLADGSLLVSFERHHRVWRYRTTAARPEPYVVAPELEKLPENGGIEAMQPLADGGLLLLAEKGHDAKGDNLGWIWRQERLWPLSYVTEGAYVPTDIARLAGGDLLVVERRFNPFTSFGSRLVRLSAAAVVPGAHLEGAELARIEWPLLTENYEALAVAPAPGGGAYVYLASDDNFNAFQSTLLLQFRLKP